MDTSRGKPNVGESDIACLCREVREELSGTEIEILDATPLGEFIGISPNRGDPVQAIVYWARVKGCLYGPSAEIVAREWVANPDSYQLSDATSKIFTYLLENDYLNNQ